MSVELAISPDGERWYPILQCPDCRRDSAVVVTGEARWVCGICGITGYEAFVDPAPDEETRQTYRDLHDSSETIRDFQRACTRILRAV